jgi:ribosomal protein S12 methylthiotransferase accessory factor YcaO
MEGLSGRVCCRQYSCISRTALDWDFIFTACRQTGWRPAILTKEAVLHGLLEVIERDVISFVTIGRATNPVCGIYNSDVQTIYDAV